MTCSLCGEPVFARGWCKMHWTRWRRHGDPNVVLKSSGGSGRVRVSDPTYRTVHKRLVAQRGKATDYPCVDCGQSAREWSYKNGGSRDRSFSADLGDYEPRCRSCHARLDRPAPRLCLTEGCNAPHEARGMCQKHYFRWYRNRVARRNTDPTKERE